MNLDNLRNEFAAIARQNEFNLSNTEALDSLVKVAAEAIERAREEDIQGRPDDGTFLLDLAREHLMSEHFAAILARRIADKHSPELIDYLSLSWKHALDATAQGIVDRALKQAKTDQYITRQIRSHANRIVQSEVMSELVRAAQAGAQAHDSAAPGAKPPEENE